MSHPAFAKDKIAVITGAADGIGLAAARHCSSLGMRVCMADLNADKLAAEAPRQIANAHTVFNIANTFIFIAFTSQFARLVERLVPDKPIEEAVITQPKYLDEELLETPSLALDRARLEIGHMGARVREMLQDIMTAIINNNRPMLKNIARAAEGIQGAESSSKPSLSR